MKRVRERINGEFTGDYQNAVKELSDDWFFILDDLGSTGHTNFREEVLFSLIDYRYNLKFPTIITMNLNKKELESQYGKRITSRIFSKENTIIDLSDVPDLRSEGL